MKKATEACIFCGMLPCECSRAVKPKKQITSSAPVVSITHEPFSFDELPTLTPVKRFKTAEPDVQPKTQDELEFEAALLNLEDILDVAVKRKYKHIFQPIVPVKLQRSIKEWRVRNGLA